MSNDNVLDCMFLWFFALCLLIVTGLAGCSGKEIRYDAAMSPIDANYYTLLMETDCDEHRISMGQGGCTFGSDEMIGSRVTVHTPLPGAIVAYSDACGIDRKDFIPEKGGSFTYDINSLMPSGVAFCHVTLYAEWQLPTNMTSEFPLRGLKGKLYLRRRPEGSTVPSLEWIPESGPLGGISKGISYSQFRAGIQSVSEPIFLKVKLDKAVASEGKWYLNGCTDKLTMQTNDFTGDEILIPRSSIVSKTDNTKSCIVFGFVVGKAADGSLVNEDIVLGVEVYDKATMKLSSSVSFQENEICYHTENSVSLALLNNGTDNQGSNDIQDCFNNTGVGKLGFFTGQGRAVYGMIEGDSIRWIQ